MALALEITRIILRYLAVVLLTIGAPPALVEPLGDPALVSMIAGLASVALAEGGWLMTKLRAVA